MVKSLLMNIMRPIVNPITSLVLKSYYQDNLELTDISANKRVLILAPHMDDETIGLGGTIKKHKKYGADVYCVFVTDGASSVSDIEKEELSNIRKQEMTLVKDILGINHIYYMDLPDGNVKSNKESLAYLKDIIQEVNPDIIYTPPFVDAHKDHIATNKIVADTLEKLDKKYSIRLYEVNCPLPKEKINIVVDVTEEYSDKVEAIEVFKSQVIAFDGFLFLNEIKKHMIQNKKSQKVETFLEVSSDQYINKMNQIWPIHENFPNQFKQVNRKVTLLWAIFKNIRYKRSLYKDVLK
ncbi:PIG-L deacetylase family protein [Virgibacillus kekensis]|uniref:PIG-L deacetylase family protein n=1 Tax=Virgibacillus kekensis TaxID=202261 RepID=A0ABV9DIQ1_9BACI